MTGTEHIEGRAIVGRDAWRRARMEMLHREKDVTHRLDALAKERQAFPWMRLEKNYVLETADGEKSLKELFGPFRQLIVYHFMFGPDWPQLCDGCTQWADACNGTVHHIERFEATWIAVSRAPIEQIERERARMNWSFVWASSYQSDFNEDFYMSAEPNTKSRQIADEIVFYDRGESGGISVFAKEQDEVFLTYSCYNRGIQQMNGIFGYVDLLPFGGN